MRETLAIVDRAYILNRAASTSQGTATEVAESPIARKFYLGESFRSVKILDRYMRRRAGRSVRLRTRGVHAALRRRQPAQHRPSRLRRARERHLAAAKYFIYTLPATLVLTFPMSMLLAVLTRDEQDIGRIGAHRDARRRRQPLSHRRCRWSASVCVASIVALMFQEFVVPYAVEQRNRSSCVPRSNPEVPGILSQSNGQQAAARTATCK